MSALSTPGGGGSTANKPTSGKQKYQKLDINSLYCANRGESSEPSSAKSQLSRKHGMQSLGKVPSARRPPANLPSLKTEIGGQDNNANPIPTTSTVIATPPCPQQITTTASAVPASATWGSLPPPASSNFRNEFPTLEAAAQPQHRTEPQLRPQTEGSWTSGGANRESAQSASSMTTSHSPAYHSIMPPFLVQGSIGNAGGATALNAAGLSSGVTPSPSAPRSPRRVPPPPAPTARLPDALQRPILRQDQLSSLDEIARDPGWAAAQDIDYDQNLDFSDEENNALGSSNKLNLNRNIEHRPHPDTILKPDPDDDEKIWAERRQKQSDDMQLVLARAKQRKEEEQRRQGWVDQDNKDRNRSEREKDRNDRERDRDHNDRDRDWSDRNERDREPRHDRDRSERIDRNDRMDRGERSERVDRERSDRGERDRPERHDRDRNERGERDRIERRDRDMDRHDRDRSDRNDRERNERDREFRDREYGREHNAYNKSFQGNIPPRFLKAQQAQHQQRPQEDKNWPRRDLRRPYREFNERDDDSFRREKDSNQLWRSDSQDYDRSGKEYDRQSSKESFSDHRKGDNDRKSETDVVVSTRTSAAEKLSEVFDRKSAGIDTEKADVNKTIERKITPPSQTYSKSPRSSVEKEIVSWNDSRFGAFEKSGSVTSAKSDVSSSKSDIKADSSSEQSNAKDIAKHIEQEEVIAARGRSNSSNSNRQSTPPDQGVKQDPEVAIQILTSKGKESQDQRNHQSQRQERDQGKLEKESFEKEKTTEQLKCNTNNYSSAPTSSTEIQKRHSNEFGGVKSEVIINEPKEIHKEPMERKSSTSSTEKRSNHSYGRFPIYVRGKDGRGRRPHRSSRSKNRASGSEASPESHAVGNDHRDRKRAPRSPRGPKKNDHANTAESVTAKGHDNFENREAFAPRGQPSRRGRGGFQVRPPPPAKRVAGYGPPNTKSPFPSVKSTDGSDSNVQSNDSDKGKNKVTRNDNRGRDRRNRLPPNGEDENWETTSEHSEGGTSRRKHGGNKAFHKNSGPRGGIKGSTSKGTSNFRGNQNKKSSDIGEITEGVGDLKVAAQKKDCPPDDGFQEVRNKKMTKDARGAQQAYKDETQTTINKSQKTQNGQSQSGNQRNVNTTRNNSEKPSQPSRGSAVPPAKGANGQYDRNRQTAIPPRFAKQRQKNQLTMSQPFGIDVSVAPPPPAVNAWDKPISQALRGHTEESQPETPAPRPPPAAVVVPVEIKPVAPPVAVTPEKASLLDGTTPPVETIIFENTNYKTTPTEMKQKFMATSTVHQKQLSEETIPFNGENNAQRRALAELIANSGRSVQGDVAESHMNAFEAQNKPEDSSDMKLDFAFDSDLGQLSEEKNKNLGMVRGNNTISPLAADLNLKIASVKKVWENVQMPAVVESTEELHHNQLNNLDQEDAPPNVCKVKPTQQLQSPPPNPYNAAVGYNFTGLSVPSPPTMLFNSSQQTGLYGAFLDQSRGQFGAFPAAPYSAPYNYQPPPDMFQTLPNQYRMAAAAAANGGAGFGQNTQMGNNPSTVLISSSTNTLMSASVKPPNQQIGAIGSKNAAAAAYYGDAAAYGGVLPGILPRTSYYGPYQPPAQPPPAYPMQLQPAQSPGFQNQFLSSQLQQVAAAAVQQMHQYRGFAPRGPPPLKSPLHENGFGAFAEAPSPKPPPAAPHSPPHHKYQAPPPHPLPPPQYNMNQQMNVNRGGAATARYPPPIQRPPAFRGPPPATRAPRHNTPYYHHNRGNGGNSVEPAGVSEPSPVDADIQQPDVKTESAHA